MALSQHDSFITTSERGLRHDILPMRLYQKAKRLGIWNPTSIDLTQDQRDWAICTEGEKETLLILTSLFQAGEESVTLDLLPLIMTIAQEGRLEEELYLTTFLWEEGKHVEFFRRFLDDVTQERRDLHHYHTPTYRALFYDELPRTMSTLLTDRSPEAVARAVVTYTMIVEGVLAETGYHSYANMLVQRQLLPGLLQGLTYLKRDESRHIAYGVFLISRLVAENEKIWSVVEARMTELLPLALGVIQELDVLLGPEEGRAFNIRIQDYLLYAMQQYQKRFARIERARTQTLEQLYQISESEEETEV